MLANDDATLASTPEISQTLDGERIKTLPSGRNLTRFALLDPHVRNTSALGGNGFAQNRLGINGKHDERERWLDQGQKNPHSAAHYGVYAFKPELALSSVDQGLNSYLGIAVWLEAHKQNLFKFRPAEDSTAAARFGELTAAVTLQILIPLLIILLLHSSFTGEKEQGTFRMLASLGVSPRGMARGKALGAAMTLGALLIPATLIGAAATFLYSGDSGGAPVLGRFAIMAVSYLLYFSVFVAASLIVSAKAKTSQIALIVLLAGWFLNCFVLPRVVTDLAGKLRPTPSAMQMTAEIEKDLELGIDGHGGRGARIEELKARTMKQYGVDSIEKLPVNFSGVQLTEADEYGYKVYDRRLGELFAIYEMQESLNDIAGAGQPRYRHFTEQVDVFHREWKNFFNPLMARRELVACNDFNLFPTYAFREEPINRVVSRLTLTFLGMGGLTALVGISGFVLYRRFQITQA